MPVLNDMDEVVGVIDLTDLVTYATSLLGYWTSRNIKPDEAATEVKNALFVLIRNVSSSLLMLTSQSQNNAGILCM
jgi:hypothetical protein